MKEITENVVEAPKEVKFNNVPPGLFTRNEYGLLTDVDYVFQPNKKVDWRKMVKSEYLVPNRQSTSETDITKLEDKDLLILLHGLKELADIRGYSSVSYYVTSASPTYVMMTCKISWLPNYETEGKVIVYEAAADASLDNTESFAQNYLAAIAENRAFARCVRSFLKINIVSKEEIGRAFGNNKSSLPPSTSETASSSQVEALEKLMVKKKITWDQLKTKMVKDGVTGAEQFASVKDIQPDIIFNYMERLNAFKGPKKAE